MAPLDYTAGENVLCYHGILIYEARILQAEDWTNVPDKEDGPHYRVHYKGWKSTWDDWVTEDRLMKLNPENVAKQKRLVEMIRRQAAEEKSSQASTNQDDKTSKSNTTSNRSTQRARKRGAGTQDDDTHVVKRQDKKKMHLVLPETLKYLLVDQWEAITANYALVPLPRKPSVTDILQEYENAAIEKNPKSKSIIQEFVTGTKVYFDRCLGSNLLYKFERGQYADLIRELTSKSKKSQDELSMSDYYGAEHLLRLFVNMPKLIQQVAMKQATQDVLEKFLNDLIQFIDENRAKYFAVEYQPTNMGYQANNKP